MECIISIALLLVGTYLVRTPGPQVAKCSFCCLYGDGACQAMGNEDPRTCSNVR